MNNGLSTAPASTTRPAPLPALVAEQAARTPAATAVVAGAGRLDYAELDRRANQLANYLAGLGVGPESMVAVYLRRDVDLVVALLGVWRAGAAYVPLDPGHPTDRRRWILGDTGADVLLTQVDLLDDGAVGPSHVVCVDSDRREIEAAADTAPPVAVDQDSAAYAIYTSGSTGTPKGVVVSHAGIGNRVAWTVDTHELSTSDRVLQKTSLSFDAAGWEVFGPLVSGGTVVLAPDGAERDPSAMVAAIIEHDVTVLQGVPSVLRLLAEEPDWARCTSLRLVFSAGEPLHAELCQRLMVTPRVRVWNTYGPTECSIDVTAHPVDPEQLTGPVPIGRPLPNLRVQVLDADRRPVPIGVVGELYVGGTGLGRGYLGRPDLTAERFVPDGYGPAGARLYRTGDQVRWRADHTLEFVGRVDDQLKVNGVRIEPAEIESALVAHPDVRAAVVVGQTDQNGNRQLAAYLVTGRRLGTAELRAFLAARLPETLVPAVFVPVERFPLTSSGKVDRGALRMVEPDPRPDHVAPRTEAERIVAGVWQDLLGVEEVGVDDDFFQLGGSSLVVVRLASRLTAAAGAQVTLSDLFTAPTVGHQARFLERGPESAVPDVTPVDRTGPLPLSFAQQRMWLSEQLSPGGAEWVTPICLRLPGTLPVGAVRAALAAVADRHEALRTRYVTVNGEPRQLVEPVADLDLTVHDAPDGSLTDVFAAQLSRGFDLTAAPPWRACLVITPGRDHVLLLTVHHIASDAATSELLERDIRAFCAGRGAALPEVPVQYPDFAAWQRAQYTGELVEQDLSFWRDTLADLPELELPLDRPRPPLRDARGALVPFEVPAEVAGALTALGRRCSATPFMTMLAGFATALGRQTGQWDIPVGTPVSGRRRPELEQVAGLFLNPLVLRCALDPAMSFERAVAEIRATTLAALAHQDLPFERLVDELVEVRDLDRTPLYQVMFNLQEGGMTARVDTDAELLTALGGASTVAKTDLTMNLWPQPDGTVHGALEYATSIFDEAGARRVVDQFVRVLTAAAADPHPRLDELELVSERERRLLLEQWSGHAVARSAETVCDRFEAARAATPDAPAIRHGGEVTTFADLDDRANQIAHQLRRSGVGPGAAVGVLLDRGPDLVAALLGVWKAGAAYVPIDASYPADRIDHMLRAAGAGLAITDSRHATRFDVPTLQVDTHRLLVGAEPTTRPPRTTDPAELAYVVFTSGSTGRPKGVLISHRALATFLAGAREADDEVRLAHGRHTGRGGGGVLFSTVAFDMAVPNMWGPLVEGQPLTMLPQDLDIADLGAHLAEVGPFERFVLTPGHLELLAGQLDAETSAALTGLLWVGGEALPRGVANVWLDRLGPGGLINTYGPTETTVMMLALPITEPQHSEVVPLGRPVADATIRVLDDNARLLPIGVPGELHIGGPCLADGYAGRPDLTAERFVPDPYGPPGARLYRTGDLVRMCPDGTVDYLGRIDEQVKVRGYRIELGEIRAVVEEHPSVRECVVIAHQDRLVAFHTGEADGLAEHCAAALPDFMIPSLLVEVPEIPLTTNAKVDRDALIARLGTAVSGGDGGASEEYVAPRDPVEERIAQRWTELLGVPIGIRHNFFAVGGHSVLAARLIAGLQEEFDLDLPIRMVFEHPTVAAMATAVEAAIRAEVAALDATDLTNELYLSEERPA